MDDTPRSAVASPAMSDASGKKSSKSILAFVEEFLWPREVFVFYSVKRIGIFG